MSVKEMMLKNVEYFQDAQEWFYTLPEWVFSVGPFDTKEQAVDAFQEHADYMGEAVENG